MKGQLPKKVEGEKSWSRGREAGFRRQGRDCVSAESEVATLIDKELVSWLLLAHSNDALRKRFRPVH